MTKKMLVFCMVTLLVAQCTPFVSPFVPQGKIIYNGDFFTEKPVIVDLADMSKHNISLPPSLRPPDVIMSGTLSLFRPTLDYFVWSNDGAYVASPCLLQGDNNLTICVWDSDFLTLTDRTPAQYPKSFRLLPPTPTDYPFNLIRNISWSPDDKLMIATPRWHAKSPCLINLESEKVECGVDSNNSFWKGFSDEARQMIAGAFIIEWSPVDINKMAMPVSRNWHPVLFRREGRVREDDFFGLPTGQYQEGIYLIDTERKVLRSIWLPPENSLVDSWHKLLWEPNGKRITFTYVTDDESNYVVASVDVDGGRWTPLFDSQDVMSQISKSIPEKFRGGTLKIFLDSWSSNGRYLLFSVNVLGDSAYVLVGAFIYDLQTKQFYELLKLTEDWAHDLRIDWLD